MHQENANILQLFKAGPASGRLKQHIRAVLFVMAVLTGIVCVTAIFFGGPKAMLAALCGGLSQIVAVLAYGLIARNKRIPAPKGMLAQHLLAEITKLIVALLLLIAGVFGFGVNAAWFIAAFVATLVAYLLVLILI